MESKNRLHVFLDANVFIRGTTLPRFPYEVLRHAAKGDFQPIASPIVLESARLYIGQEYFVLNHGITLNEFALPDIAPEPNALVYIGNFHHYPNVDAMRFFIQEMWGAILRELPDAHLYLVGANPTQEIREMADGAHFTVTGRVADIRPLIQRASIGIAPLVSGAGLRGKVMEYAALRRTFVATSIAMSDLVFREGVDYLLADQAEDFVRRVVTLLKDPGLARKMGESAYDTVCRNYDNHRLVDYMDRLYAHLESGSAC